MLGLLGCGGTEPEGMPLEAVLTATPDFGVAPLTVTFNADSSTGPIVRYELDVDGDGRVEFAGSTASAVSETFTYQQPGLYKARLKLTDGTGAQATDEVPLTAAVALVPVGRSPEGFAVSPDGARVFVANHLIFEGTPLWVFDTSNFTLIAKVPTQAGPEGIAILPDGSKAYVVSKFFGLDVVDGRTFQLLKSFDFRSILGVEYFEIAITPDGRRTYVTAEGNGTTTGGVVVIDTERDEVVAGLRLHPFGSLAVDVSPDSRFAYAASVVGGKIFVIDTARQTPVDSTTIEVPKEGLIYALKASPDGSKLYIAIANQFNSGPGRIVVLGRRDLKVQQSIELNVGAGSGTPFAISPDGEALYIPEGNMLNVLHTGTLALETFLAAGDNLGLGPDGRRLYMGPKFGENFQDFMLVLQVRQ